MYPKSRFLFKHTVFIKAAAFVLLIPLLLAFSLLQNKEVADAQIALLHSTSCLGGWKNVDKATGIPEVLGNKDVQYSDENSATLYNKQTQIYCGGFSGSIPETMDRTKVSLRFSWSTDEAQQESEAASDDLPEGADSGNSPDYPGVTGTSSESTNQEQNITQPESAPEQPVEDPVSEENSTPEESTETESVSETVSFFDLFIPTVFAQEEVVEVPSPSAPESTVPEIEETPVSTEAVQNEAVIENPPATDVSNPNTEATSTATSTSLSGSSTVSSYLSPYTDQNTDKDEAIFEVLFTMDNTEWYQLGYVSRINNDIQFELPLELFTSVEDFNKVQISLKTVERFDNTPKIYLDSMWLEVSYIDAGQDPLSPPGTLEGDIIMSSISTQDMSLVTVFRGVELETVSNILSVSATSTASSTATSSSSSSTSTVEMIAEVATTTATSSATSTSLISATTTIIYESDISLEVRDELRATPGVEVELWYMDRLTGAWSRVADNSILATVPKAFVLDNRVFWFGVKGESLWVFDISAKSYNSQSLSPGEPLSIEYVDSIGERKQAIFDSKNNFVTATTTPAVKE